MKEDPIHNYTTLGITMPVVHIFGEFVNVDCFLLYLPFFLLFSLRLPCSSLSVFVIFVTILLAVQSLPWTCSFSCRLILVFSSIFDFWLFDFWKLEVIVRVGVGLIEARVPISSFSLVKLFPLLYYIYIYQIVTQMIQIDHKWHMTLEM